MPQQEIRERIQGMRTTLTINQIVDEWLANSDVLPITKQSYRNKTGLWFRYLIQQKIDPRAAKRSDVLDYKHGLEDGGYSQLTVDGYITAVKLFYAYCESARYCENIAAGIRTSARSGVHRKQALTTEQTRALLTSIDTETLAGKRDVLIIALMLYSGLRTCEVQRINICDFDIQGGDKILTIQRKGRREKAETIGVTDGVMELVEDYIACRNFDITDPLFVAIGGRHRGERLTKFEISRIVKGRMRAIGIDQGDITAHSLRHTFGALLVEQGADLEKVRDSMGHTSTNTTRIYVSQAQRRMLIRNNPAKHIEEALGMVGNAPKEKILNSVDTITCARNRVDLRG